MKRSSTVPYLLTKTGAARAVERTETDDSPLVGDKTPCGTSLPVLRDPFICQASGPHSPVPTRSQDATDPLASTRVAENRDTRDELEPIDTSLDITTPVGSLRAAGHGREEKRDATVEIISIAGSNLEDEEQDHMNMALLLQVGNMPDDASVVTAQTSAIAQAMLDVSHSPVAT